MKRILRYIIAIIFIASGFVKAIDVKGFSFKLEEYFSPDVFNLTFLQNFTLEIAILVVALELVLGLMLLLKVKLKCTLISLIALCVFFAFLTFYSAYFNKVTDCGCFGDAIKFTPWQSFWKDMALLFGLIILWFLNKKSDTLNNEKGFLKMPFLGIGILISAYVIYYGIVHEPLIDFRDYKIGTDLNVEKQKISVNPSEYKTSYTLKNAKTSEEKVVGQDDFINQKEYWEEGTPWQIQKGKEVSVLVKQGYQSSIDKFKLEDENGNDITEQILHLPKVVIFFSYAPEKIKENDKNFLEYGIEDFIFNYKELNPKSEFYGVSTQKSFFKKVKSLTMDGTAIKTIARSNPFVLILENGKIVEKKSLIEYMNQVIPKE
ncbi:BT_3928 family protein [Cloacibacterium caeni]|uniref:BT_3928 family protein n=1 Tax=Cloacibacterium caeni TaxID=2004710 RepID=UPI001BCF0CC5|nr:BT_3928 family protein [Cloacibacterium caeni]